jgi:hypothetical protein
MAPICLQFWGANAHRYYEYGGAAGMRALWPDAINVTHPEWVEIITRNDFIEGTYTSPIDDPNRYPNANFLTASGIPLGTRGYFHSHAGATALLSFLIQWYKTGIMPQIKHDAIYYFYRTQPAALDTGNPPVAHSYGPVADLIYITANLTAPADLRVTTGGVTTITHLSAGSTDTKTPFYAGGPPSFELLRGGRILPAGKAEDPIAAAPKLNDFHDATGELSVP